jgi:FlaA1/EpsC-like NDP-sugar epimerase
VPIKITGLRDGEKLQEELFYANEQVHSTACEKIKRAVTTHNGWPQLRQQLEELRTAVSLDGAGPLRAKLKEIVPEYKYSPDGSGAPEKYFVNAVGACDPKKGHRH